ncbi:MAG: hypothetical protein ACRDNW_00140 [Trebonia sp.]
MVNSALQRAHAQLKSASPAPDALAEPDDAASRDLLSRYTAAFQVMDVASLKRTLREGTLLQMPPYPAWFSGRDMPGRTWATWSWLNTLPDANLALLADVHGDPAAVALGADHFPNGPPPEARLTRHPDVVRSYIPINGT